MQILVRDFRVSPVVAKSPSVRERSQERAIEASKAIDVTGRQKSSAHSYDQSKAKPQREAHDDQTASEMRVGQLLTADTKGRGEPFKNKR